MWEEKTNRPSLQRSHTLTHPVLHIHFLSLSPSLYHTQTHTHPALKHTHTLSFSLLLRSDIHTHLSLSAKFFCSSRVWTKETRKSGSRIRWDSALQLWSCCSFTDSCRKQNRMRPTEPQRKAGSEERGLVWDKQKKRTVTVMGRFERIWCWSLDPYLIMWFCDVWTMGDFKGASFQL